jgi:lactate dehydrogenase-like 2-hydroxyacid dehydrogenase
MAKPDVLMTGPMQSVVAETLRRETTLHVLSDAPDREAFLREVGPRIRGAAVSSGHGPFNKTLMEALPNLEIVANFGVGYDNVEVAEAAKRGIVVTNTPDVLNEEVADTAMGLLLAAVRQIPQADRYLRAGRWPEKPYPLTASLRGRKAGILGLGRIGKTIAQRLETFGITVAYHGRSQQADVPYAYYPTLVGLAEAVDILIVIIPGGSSTYRIVNAEVLKALGSDGILINVARGTVVDEPALIEALRSGTILTAGLDVFEHEPTVPQELIDMEHVVLLPHVGSATVHTRNAMGQLVADNLVSWLSGKGPLTPVAETPWKR